MNSLLTITIWRSLFGVRYLVVSVEKGHSVSGQRLGNGFFTFFDAYLQVIIYKFHSIVNIKFLYKVCNFSNRCKFLFLRESCVWETFFCTDRKPIISGFFKTFSYIFTFVTRRNWNSIRFMRVYNVKILFIKADFAGVCKTLATTDFLRKCIHNVPSKKRQTLI